MAAKDKDSKTNLNAPRLMAWFQNNFTEMILLWPKVPKPLRHIEPDGRKD